MRIPEKNRRFILLLLLMITCTYSALSQDMTGTWTGNYAGTQAVQINPSALHNSKTWLDVHLLGADLFLQNNFLYMSKADYRFTNFFKPDYVWPTHEEEYGTEERIFYYYNNTVARDVYGQVRINGPGAMVNWGKHAFALTTAVRTVLSVNNAPYELAKFAYLGLNYRPQQNINYIDNRPFSVSAMAWMEIGLTWSYLFHARGFNKWSAGITAKRLMAWSGGYVSSRQLDYIVQDDSTVVINNLDATMAIAPPVAYNEFVLVNDPLFKGKGFGVDLGVTYTRLKRSYQHQYISKLCAQRYDDYLYRIGVSLMDVGAVSFKDNATKMVIDNRSALWENVTSLNIRNLDHLLDTISYRFYGDTTSAYAGNRFTMWLPMSLSIQADYHYRDNWYVNASLVYGLNWIAAGLTRPTELIITPRYESNWLEVNLPVSLYNWTQPRVGLSVRVYGFTVGTEKLGGFFHFSNFTGMDFYFSIRFFLEKGRCGGGKPRGCLDQEQERRRSKF